MFKSFKFGLLFAYASTAFAVASGQSHLQGKMYGGQLPIAGGHVYLLSPAQNTTFGSASVSLLTSGDGNDAIGYYVLTDQNGNFNIDPSQYQCPAANIPTYAYASMGNAGYGPNSAIANMIYVSLCGDIASVQYLQMNEATTVALAYAVAGYATDPLHISYSGTPASLTGIQNAFANANNLANPEYGTANSTIPSGYATAPQATVNTIADALASCINQTTQGSNTSNCAMLFSAASVTGVAPTTTAAAAMNIAHNPASSTSPQIQNGTNIAWIITLANAYEQFVPILSSPPNDLTLSLNFTGSNFAYPTALAIDGSGNAWIASQEQFPMLPNGSVVEIANPTAMLANSVTYPIVYTPQTEPESIAVDAASQNIWIGTDGGVEEISNTGIPALGSPFLTNDPNFAGPSYALNLDTTGNVWIAGLSTVYKLSPTGSVLSPSGGYPLPAGLGASPSALALDFSNNVWITDYYNSALVELTPQGGQAQNFDPGTSGNAFNLPNGVAIDANKNVWVANNGNNNFVEYLPINQIPFAVAEADIPPPSPNTPMLTFVAIDGAGNSWYSLQNAACPSSTACFGVAEVSGAGRPLSGPGYEIIGNNMGDATVYATAIDGSGDVWMLNKNAQSVTELVGAAAPVVTSLALAVSTNGLGARP